MGDSWKEFVRNPTQANYQRLAGKIAKFSPGSCSIEIDPSLEVTDRLVALIYHGNVWAINIALISLPFIQCDAAGLEDIDRSLASIADTNPREFLELVTQYHISDLDIRNMIGMQDENLIDDLQGQYNADKRRIRALSSVEDKAFTKAKAVAISSIKEDMDILEKNGAH
jgi:hypothetical protein